MLRMLIAGFMVLGLLVGCASLDRADFATEADYNAAVFERQERLERAGRFAEVARLVAVQQIETLNAAGMDPIQWPPDKLMKASAFCSLATALVTVVNANAAELSEEGARLCGTILKALAAAPTPAPILAPIPPPAPALKP